MDRNRFLRAMKLYLKAALNPLTISFAILFSGFMLAIFIFDPDPVGSKDYNSMISSMQMGKVGFFFVIMMGSMKLQQNKFYASCCCGKAIFIAAPIVTSLIMSLIYDAAIAVSAAVNLGSTGLADFIVSDSVSSTLFILASACYGKKGLSWGFAIPYIMFMCGWIFIDKTGVIDGILGMSVRVSAAIAASVYVISVVLSLIVTNAWWKKGDKFNMPNKYVTNAIGGQ